MYACLYVCICVNVWMYDGECMYMFKCVYMYARTHKHSLIRKCTHACMHACNHVNTHTHTHTHTNTIMKICLHMRLTIQTHTHTHTHTHTLTQAARLEHSPAGFHAGKRVVHRCDASVTQIQVTARETAGAQALQGGATVVPRERAAVPF
jgi:hypothetical protein